MTPTSEPRTFGIEEELVLLRPGSLAPADVAPAVLARLDERMPGTSGEFLACQLEHASAVHRSADAALAELRAVRRALAAAADAEGALLASVGVPPGSGAAAVSEGERYVAYGERLAGLMAGHRIQALHVHVGIDSREEGLRALMALRPWLAVLHAATANAPIAHGADTGFASWRMVETRRFGTWTAPPLVADLAEHDRRSAALVGIASTLDAGAIAWHARLSARYPTIEVRVCDAQPTAAESVAVAALVRALVAVAAEGGLPHAAAAAHPELVEAALWHAARFGMAEGLVDPETGALAPAWSVVERMLALARPALDAAGDAARVDAWVEGVRGAGTGAERQRRALAEGGLPVVGALLRAAVAD